MLSGGQVAGVAGVSNNDGYAHEVNMEITAVPKQDSEDAPSHDDYRALIKGQTVTDRAEPPRVEIIPPSESEPYTMTIRLNTPPQGLERPSDVEATEDRISRVASDTTEARIFAPFPAWVESLMSVFGTFLQAHFEITFNDDGYISEIRITDPRRLLTGVPVIQNDIIQHLYKGFAFDLIKNIRVQEWQDNNTYDYYFMLKLYGDGERGSYGLSMYRCVTPD